MFIVSLFDTDYLKLRTSKKNTTCKAVIKLNTNQTAV
jgi:hypothetical protein